jgi:hypothetical protein
MAELANRGYNVALPEIDIGDDIFAVNDSNGNMWRLQVKTSVAKQRKKVQSGQFRIRQRAIMTPTAPELHFVLVLRVPDRFRFVIISRDVLNNYVVADNLGSAATTKGVAWRQFYLTITPLNKATCSGKDVSHLIENWSTWPIL